MGVDSVVRIYMVCRFDDIVDWAVVLLLRRVWFGLVLGCWVTDFLADFTLCGVGII